MEERDNHVIINIEGVDCNLFRSIVCERDNLDKWLCSDAHLMLSKPVLEEDKGKRWKTIREDWNDCVQYFAEEAWHRDKSNPIFMLAESCEERFYKTFRREGVELFFAGMENSIGSIAKTICQNIQEYMSYMYNPDSEAIVFIDTLVWQSEKRITYFDEKSHHYWDEIEKLQKEMMQNQLEWHNIGIITALFGKKKKLFRQHVEILQHLYTFKTELEGMRFAKKLLPEVIKQLKLTDAWRKAQDLKNSKSNL